jgi:hypothetical protein
MAAHRRQHDHPDGRQQHDPQDVVDDDMRGRVMAFFTMCFMGMVPIGSLLSGSLANSHRRPAHGHVRRGSFCIVGGIVFPARPPAPAQAGPSRSTSSAGLLPEVAVGIRDADVATQNVAG